jgi:hypothetical protein
MAVRSLSVTPDIPSFIQTVEVADVEIRIRLKWRERLDGWYASLFFGENEDNPLAYDERIEPGQLLFEFEVPPESGAFYVRGPLEDYDREDLGSTLEILFVSPVE